MRVEFISRYWTENDYMVNGRRIRLEDDGRISATDGRPATSEERRAVILFELDRYADYLRWHSEKRREGVFSVDRGWEHPFNYSSAAIAYL